MRIGDFSFDSSSQVYVSNVSSSSVRYRDGSEDYLAETFRQSADVTLFSPELRSKIKDWPSFYHLSPLRSTIFDCLGLQNRNLKVLELGAGCGAVTRWLGEHFSEVYAVEGSVERARLARQRCHDLDHVKVFSANFLDVEWDTPFDVVTLIGVLEYSSSYHPVHKGNPLQASLATLKHVRGLLKDGGMLVLAIENKFGMKYFSGAKEDHSGRYFDGIQGYPGHSGAVTFGFSELRRLLNEAGFGSIDVYLPFPDYKHATTMINGQVDSSQYYLHNWIETPFPESGGRREFLIFNEGLAIRELCKSNLLKELSNSFLILAYPGEGDESRQHVGLDARWIAKHYSFNRYPAFCKRITLGKDREGRLMVHAEIPFAKEAGGEDPEAPFRHTLSHDEYYPGDLLLFRVFEVICSKNFNARFSEFLREMNQFLLEHFSAGQEDGAGIPMLGGRALDITPWNIIVDGTTGRWSVIDNEWDSKFMIPADLVLWRTLYYLVSRFHSFFTPHLSGLSNDHFIAAALAQLYPAFNDQRYHMARELERAFQFFVTRGTLTAELRTIINSLFPAGMKK